MHRNFAGSLGDFKKPGFSTDHVVMQNDGFEVCERPGICMAPSYVVSTDGKNKFGDALRIQNTTLMPDA